MNRLAMTSLVCAAASLLACGLPPQPEDCAGDQTCVAQAREAMMRTPITDPGELPPGGNGGSTTPGTAPPPAPADLVRLDSIYQCTPVTGGKVSVFVDNVGGTNTNAYFYVTATFATTSGNVVQHAYAPARLTPAMGVFVDFTLPTNCLRPSCSGYQVYVDSLNNVSEGNESNNISIVNC